MKRALRGLKQFSELYLIIVGGGYALTGLVGLVVSVKDFFRSSDETETRALREDIRVDFQLFFFALLFLIAGIGIYKSRLWGLVLALGLAITVMGYSLVQNQNGMSDYHDFTVALPMGVIFLWGILPPTWQMFRRQDVKPS